MSDDNIFLCPDGTTFDIATINEAARRVNELAIVTRIKAPELMSLFARASFELSRIIPKVLLSHQLAKQTVAKRAAILMVDIIPGKIAEMQLSGNAETRQAFVDKDDEYNKYLEIELQWNAAKAFFTYQFKSVEGALNAIKKAVADLGPVFNRPNFDSNTAPTNDNWDIDLSDKPTRRQ
jgi:hypothetical protein